MKMQVAVIVVGTAASYAIGWAVGSPWLLPFLNAAPAWPLMARAVRRGNLLRALALMLLWAAMLGAIATIWSRADEADTARLFLHADQYRLEMFEWLITGRGAESDLRRFLPQHAAHAAIFCVLSLATGSALSMPLGAALMNYMGHYAGTLAARSASPAVTALLAWHPWAIVRIASFVTLGVALAEPAVTRRARFDSVARRLLAVGGCGLLVDTALKWALAPTWRALLVRAVGW